MRYDIVIIGGGIVGLATAHFILSSRPYTRLLLLEKEPGPAMHQTGHNSGVIHSGIYYTPGTLKAQFARQGGAAMVEFCVLHGIAHEVCGKVIVATDAVELPRLEAILARGIENGLQVNRLTAEELHEREPHVAGIAALEVPSTGIVDYIAVAHKLEELIRRFGGEIQYNSALTEVRTHADHSEIITPMSTALTSTFVTCTGLHSDVTARLSGADPQAQIIPFRGEYYTLKPQARRLIRHLVYPFPNPAFPFLGVHFTRMVNGEVHAGPNAVLALRREGYEKSDFSIRDFGAMLAYSGFRRLIANNWREGCREMRRSFFRKEFLKSLQRLVPEIQDEDIEPSAAGVRAMAVLPDGKMVDDFLVVPGPRSLHVCNAPSPAATASLMTGEYVARLAAERF